MTSWRDVRLKDLCTDAGQYGVNVSSGDYVSEGVRLLRTTDISTGILMPEERGVFVSAVPEKRFKLQAGDLLLSRSGTPPGQSYLVRDVDAAATFAGYLVRFRPRQTQVEPRFLSYVARSAPFQHAIHSEAVASTIQNFNAERYANIAFQVPGLSEQRRIADFLDLETARIDKMSKLQSSALSKIMERESAVLDHELDALYEKSGSLPFRRFVVGVDQGSSPQCDAVPAEDGEWGVLKVSCLRPGVFDSQANKRLPDGTAPDRRSEVREGDLLITRANTPQLVGSTAVVPQVRPKLLLSDKIFRVRLAGGMDPHYVSTVARGSRVRAACSAASNGASQSMANLRFEEIKDWPIPPVSPDEQAEFVNRVTHSWRQANALREKINHQLALLAERRHSLITAAVTGQLDVTTAQQAAAV